MSNFDESIKETFEKHGVDNKELESALIDVFNSFESRILSQDFTRKVLKEIEKKSDRDKAAWGG